MVTPIISENRFSQEFASRVRRFFRWITKPEVALAIIMLALMIYLIIIPLYRMAATTLTIQAKDLVTHPEAAEGDFTLFHWSRMLTSKISKIMLYAPLQHSIVTALGATAIAMFLGCIMAWFVVRTDMPGRKLINVLAIIPYMLPSWTISMAWTVVI